jgi:hypothetical protein
MQQRVPDPVKPPRPAARQQQQGAARPGVAVARGLGLGAPSATSRPPGGEP